MTPTREPSLGEVAENIQHLTRAVEALKITIETTYVRKDVYDIAHKSLTDKVVAGQRVAWWALVLVCGLVIASLVAFIAQVGGTT